MDTAYLHESVFDIEKKRIELEQQNLNRSEIIRWFENHYRVFSKKSAFTCVCCQKPVTMNLTRDEGRPFYFRHNDENACSYSENTKTYDYHVSTYENKGKKDIGLTVFREILEGQLKPHGIQIERGFHYKKKLSFIPDFILTFPTSNERWVIDYYTAMDKGLASGSYARHLAKRMKTYEEEGLKVLSFVDSSWLSFVEETGKGTLLAAETHVTRKSREDHLWDTFLSENLQEGLASFFSKQTGVPSPPFNTQSIAYVNLSNRVCTIFRFIETSLHNRNTTVYNLSTTDIPLEQAVSLNYHSQDSLPLIDKNEDDKRADFLKSLIEKKQMVEIEHRKKEEELERLKAEDERKQARLKSKYEEWLRKSKLQPRYERKMQNNQRVQTVPNDEEIEREMQERARKAAMRPVHVDPNRLDSRTYNQDRYYKNTNQQNYSNPLVENFETKAEKQKRTKVRDRLLTQPIPGENYINGDNAYWRKVVLKWINENQVGNLVQVPIPELMKYMEQVGVSFNQPKLASYPIKEFLEFYKKVLRSEMKKKIELSIRG